MPKKSFFSFRTDTRRNIDTLKAILKKPTRISHENCFSSQSLKRTFSFEDRNWPVLIRPTAKPSYISGTRWFRHFKVDHRILWFGRPGIFPPRKVQNFSDFTIFVLGPWGEGMSTHRFFFAMEMSKQIIKIKIISLQKLFTGQFKIGTK